MGTVLVAVTGVFIALGSWMIVTLLTEKYLGERSPGCGCGLHSHGAPNTSSQGQKACGRCTVQLSEPRGPSVENKDDQPD